MKSVFFYAGNYMMCLEFLQLDFFFHFHLRYSPCSHRLSRTHLALLYIYRRAHHESQRDHLQKVKTQKSALRPHSRIRLVRPLRHTRESSRGELLGGLSKFPPSLSLCGAPNDFLSRSSAHLPYEI